MKKKMALIFGGNSAEHRVSLMSSKAVFENIDKSIFDLVLLGLDMDGEPYIFDAELMSKLPDEGFLKENKISKAEFTRILTEEVDLAFPMMHGPSGEDGKIQGYFDFIGLPYIGCDHMCSAICMDKAYHKYLLQVNNFNILPFEVVLKYDYDKNREEVLNRITGALEYPLFVKPSNMGSSVGITKAKDRDSLIKAIELAYKYDNVIVVEHGINAAEFECGVFGYRDYKATVVGEIKPSHEFYDYDAKYSDACLSVLEIPALISKEKAEYIKTETIKAAKLFRVRGLSRIDYLMDKDTGEIYISEINTMPGFTKYSMYPTLASHIGLSYKDLITELANIALGR